MTTVTPAGDRRTRFNNGFRQMGLRLQLGVDLLPSILQDVPLIVEADGELAVWQRDALLPQTQDPCPGYPGAGLLAFQPIQRRASARRARTGWAAEDDASDQAPAIADALLLLQTFDPQVPDLQETPFSSRVMLMDVLDEVSKQELEDSGQQGQFHRAVPTARACQPVCQQRACTSPEPLTADAVCVVLC